MPSPDVSEPATAAFLPQKYDISRILHVCAACEKPDAVSSFTCPQCKVVHECESAERGVYRPYIFGVCDRDCQRVFWKRHKATRHCCTEVRTAGADPKQMAEDERKWQLLADEEAAAASEKREIEDLEASIRQIEKCLAEQTAAFGLSPEEVQKLSDSAAAEVQEMTGKTRNGNGRKGRSKNQTSGRASRKSGQEPVQVKEQKSYTTGERDDGVYVHRELAGSAGGEQPCGTSPISDPGWEEEAIPDTPVDMRDSATRKRIHDIVGEFLQGSPDRVPALAWNEFTGSAVVLGSQPLHKFKKLYGEDTGALRGGEVSLDPPYRLYSFEEMSGQIRLPPDDELGAALREGLQHQMRNACHGETGD